MERQACEVIIGVGIGAAILAAFALIRHLRNAGRSADADDMARYLREKDEETKQ